MRKTGLCGFTGAISLLLRCVQPVNTVFWYRTYSIKHAEIEPVPKTGATVQRQAVLLGTCCAENHCPLAEVTSKFSLPHWNATKTLASAFVPIGLFIVWLFFFFFAKKS